jgi:hypothetical protein
MHHVQPIFLELQEGVFWEGFLRLIFRHDEFYDYQQNRQATINAT